MRTSCEVRDSWETTNSYIRNISDHVAILLSYRPLRYLITKAQRPPPMLLMPLARTHDLASSFLISSLPGIRISSTILFCGRAENTGSR